MQATLKMLGTTLLAAVAAACAVSVGDDDSGSERFPTSASYPPETMERIAFTAGVPEGWRISALQTPARADADWKVVIVTGTPSWSEYWAPTIAGLPTTREMIVADRPGFRTSEPQDAVRDLATQADALAPMLAARDGQRVLLVGQSFGAPVATLMAQRYPDRVDAILFVSAFFGDRGPTARRMFGAGRLVQGLLPRDLRNSIVEVGAQRAQLPAVFDALDGLSQPIVFIHGDKDTFVPLDADRRIAEERGHSFVVVSGGDHFLNACCVSSLLETMERAIAEAEARDAAAATIPAAP